MRRVQVSEEIITLLASDPTALLCFVTKGVPIFLLLIAWTKTWEATAILKLGDTHYFGASRMSMLF